MKLQEFLAINGAKVTAEKLVNMRVQYVTGLSMSDLPDRTELWDIVEDIEEELNEEDFSMQRIKESLQDITPEFIEEICW
jgi:predicted RNA-binding protein with EMAP domain